MAPLCSPSGLLEPWAAPPPLSLIGLLFTFPSGTPALSCASASGGHRLLASHLPRLQRAGLPWSGASAPPGPRVLWRFPGGYPLIIWFWVGGGEFHPGLQTTSPRVLHREQTETHLPSLCERWPFTGPVSLA